MYVIYYGKYIFSTRLEKTFINGILTAENIKNTPKLHTHKYKVYSNIYASKITLFYTQIFDMKFRF